ncbi:glutathione S-transferase 1-like isoform X2 [Bradysia coprophila]|uniref:glutathione S-transferase 1-like isoform X2 n=1 Tax=Bradysia coprophila TaxID=38358 RepID=UPI00187D7BA5|nr:glutathione S-transferase 1-like isoform X2 [Bradysia coprophila]
MSSKIILYYLSLSPPVRSVLLTAKALGIDLDLRNVNLLEGDHLKPEFIKLNPQHTVPTIDDNGVIIYDSHVICGYLVDKYAKDDSLYPKDIVQRAQVNARLHFDTGFLFARLRFMFEPIFFFGESELPTWKVEYMQKCWDLMEAFLANGIYVCGDSITIADHCCISSISSVDRVAPIDADKYPKLSAWKKLMEALPYYQVNAEGAADVQKFLFDTLEKRKTERVAAPVAGHLLFFHS